MIRNNAQIIILEHSDDIFGGSESLFKKLCFVWQHIPESSRTEVKTTNQGLTPPKVDIVEETLAEYIARTMPKPVREELQAPDIQAPDIQAPAVQRPQVQRPKAQHSRAQGPADRRPPARRSRAQAPAVQGPQAQAPAQVQSPAVAGHAIIRYTGGIKQRPQMHPIWRDVGLGDKVAMMERGKFAKPRWVMKLTELLMEMTLAQLQATEFDRWFVVEDSGPVGAMIGEVRDVGNMLS